MSKIKITVKKGKAKEVVTSLADMRRKAEKLEELKKLGLDTKELENITLEEFNKLYNEFAYIADKIDLRRQEFINQLIKYMGHWSFEELFVFMIDVLNTKLMEFMERDEKGNKVHDLQVEDIFPVLYDKVYTTCLNVLVENYKR